MSNQRGRRLLQRLLQILEECVKVNHRPYHWEIEEWCERFGLTQETIREALQKLRFAYDSPPLPQDVGAYDCDPADFRDAFASALDMQRIAAIEQAMSLLGLE